MKKGLFIGMSYICTLLALSTVQAEESTGEDYYYGFGVTQDYDKAFQLFSEEKNISYLVMMYINGEGRPKDLNKARELLEKEAEHCFHVSDLQHEIERRMGIPEQEQKPIGFCDLARTTLEINYCGLIQNKLSAKNHKLLFEQTKKELPPKAQKILEEIEEQALYIQEMDSSRMYTTYMSGTIRGIAASSTRGYIQERHHRRILSVLSNRKLSKFSKEEFQHLDTELNRVYQQQITSQKEYYEELYSLGSADPAHAKKIMEEQLINLRNAQRAWIRYRDLWAELLCIHRPQDFANEQAIIVSIKALLTKERTEELIFDPVGPG